MEALRNAGPYNLSTLQADIIAFLHGDPRPRRQGDIVVGLASTAPTVSDAVRVLRTKNLIEGTRDPEDARAVRLRLTPLGRAEAARLSVVSGALSEAITVLAEDDFAAMLRGAMAVMRELQERQAIPISRMCFTCRFFESHAHPQEARLHHCHFVDAPFGDAELRVACPDHEDVAAA